MNNKPLPTITQAFPPLPLKKLISWIQEFPKLPVSEQKSIITELVSAHIILNLEWGKGWRYRRARKLKENEIPSTIDDLIWRKDVPANEGRCNPSGVPRLYT